VPATERRGWWSLPAHPEFERPGIWSAAPEWAHSRLEVEGPLEPALAEPAVLPLRTNHPVVFGRTRSGDAVTLCEGSGWIGVVGDIRDLDQMAETLHFQVAFIGAHLVDGLATSFRRVQLEVENLSTWARPPLPEWSDHVEPDGSRRYRYDYFVPAPVEADVGQALIRLVPGFRSTWSAAPEEQRVTLPVIIEIIPSSQSSYEAVMGDIAWPLRQFLTLAFNAPCNISKTWVSLLDRGVNLSEEDMAAGIQNRLEVVEPRRSAEGEDSLLVDMLFAFGDVRAEFAAMLAKWFQLRSSLQEAFNLLFAGVLGPDASLQTRFLFVVQAIEVFHRHFSSETRESAEAFAERKQRVLGAVAREDHDWLEGELAWSNELKLADRLEQVVGLGGAHVTEVMMPDFVRRATRTRNYLTHYDPRNARRAAHSEELYWLCEEAFVLMQLVLLGLLGLDDERRWELVRRTQRASRLARRVQAT